MSRIAPTADGKQLVRLFDRPIPDLDADTTAGTASAVAAGVGPTVASGHVGEPVDVLWCAFQETGPALWVGNPMATPAGATLRSANVGNLQSRLNGLSWTSVDLTLHDERTDLQARSSPTLEEILIGRMAVGPTAWAIEARPVDVRQTDQWEAWTRIAGRGEKGTVGDQVEAKRARRLLELLEAEAAQGLWSARLFCGGQDEPSAKHLLGLLFSSAGLSQLPVVVSHGQIGIPIVTSSVVAAFARPPVTELPGIRIRRTAEWDLAPESKGPIIVGDVLSPTDHPFSELSVPLATINRHTFVAGATGSGKSETVRRLLQQLSAEDIPWMVVEPAKAEYHVMADLVAPREVVLLKLGDAGRTPFSLNPLEPSVVLVDGRARRFPLGTHLSLVRSLFEAAFQPDEPFPQILAAALERSFSQRGWDVATGRPVAGSVAQALSYPTLTDLRRNALDVVSDLGYGKEVSDNVRGFVDVRISSLRSGIAGQFFESGHPLELESLTDRNVVLQLEDLGNEQDQAFLIGALLIRWSELLRLKGDSGGELRHVLVLEEAHRLLRDDKDSPHSVEQFANLLAEIRSYGEGVIVAEQIPSKIISDVVKNSALKIVHRLPAEEDRQKVGATMNLGPAQSRSVVALSTGQAAVHADGMDRPMRVRVPAPPTVPAGRGRVTEPRHRFHTLLCGKQNKKAPCSVEEIEVGRRLAADPLFASWVDLAVLSRLVGEDFPSLSDDRLAKFKVLAGRSRRRLVCAVGLAVHASVASRSFDMVQYYEPAELEAQVGEQILWFLVKGRRPGKASTEWQAGSYRWVDLALVLTGEPSSLTAERLSALIEDARKRDLVLTGSSPAELFESLRSAQLAVSRPHHETIFGRPSALREAMVTLRMDSSALFARLGATDSWIATCFGKSEADSASGADLGGAD